MQVIEVIKIRRTTTLAQENCIPESFKFQQGLATRVHLWRHHRNFKIGKFEREFMFFENLQVSPAFWTVEFDDDRISII
jgi:hypothetical protein